VESKTSALPKRDRRITMGSVRSLWNVCTSNACKFLFCGSFLILMDIEKMIYQSIWEWEGSSRQISQLRSSGGIARAFSKPSQCIHTQWPQMASLHQKTQVTDQAPPWNCRTLTLRCQVRSRQGRFTPGTAQLDDILGHVAGCIRIEILS